MIFRTDAGSSTNQPEVAKAKSGDQSVTSSTALVDETNLQFPIGANETWIFTWTLSATFSAVGQVKVAVVTPAGATLLVVAQMTPNGILPAFGTTTTSGTAITLTAVLSTSGLIVVTATVVNGATAGTVKLQFAQGTSDGTATTLKSASSMIARKV